MKLGYARVSTFEQNLDLQLDALKLEGCNTIFTDKVSGTSAVKPNFLKLLEYARPDDTIVIWKLDRLGRTTLQLIELMQNLNNKGIHLKSISETIDTKTSMGILFFQFICILAEHEANIIKERTLAGLNAARSRGKRGGRPKGLSKHYQTIAPEVKLLYLNGSRTTQEIRTIFNIKSQPTLYKILQFADLDVKGFVKKRKSE